MLRLDLTFDIFRDSRSSIGSGPRQRDLPVQRNSETVVSTAAEDQILQRFAVTFMPISNQHALRDCLRRPRPFAWVSSHFLSSQ
jgi:hypothetical protein